MMASINGPIQTPYNFDNWKNMKYSEFIYLWPNRLVKFERKKPTDCYGRGKQVILKETYKEISMTDGRHRQEGENEEQTNMTRKCEDNVGKPMENRLMRVQDRDLQVGQRRIHQAVTVAKGCSNSDDSTLPGLTRASD